MSYYNKQDKVLSILLKVSKKLSSTITLFKKNIPHKVFYKYQNNELKKFQVFVECSHGHAFSGNIFSICKWLNDNLPQYRIVVAARNPQRVEKRILDAGINAQVVKWYSIEYMQELAVSKFLFNDTTFYPFFIKRSDQVYVNTWHGTPLKKLGNHLTNPIASGNVQKNFLLSDYIWVSNGYTKDRLISAYQLEGLYKGEVITGPCPRNNTLYNENIRNNIREKISVQNETIILYMPTWRDQYGIGKAMPEGCEQHKFLHMLENSLPDNYIVYYKFHDYVRDTFKSSLGKVRKIPVDIELYDFLSASDVLITDYSSVMFDYLGTGRSVYLYTYDDEDYLQNRGLYLDIDTLPFFKYRNAEDIIDNLLGSDSLKTTYSPALYEQYTPYDSLSIDKVMEYILGMDCNDQDSFSTYKMDNKKKNIGIYAGGLWDNGITVSLMNLLDSISVDIFEGSVDNNYIVFCESNRVEEKHFYKVRDITKQVYFFPLIGKFQGGGCEKLLYYGFLKISVIRGKWVERIARKLYQREYDRTLGALDLDHVVHYTGYDRKQAAIISLSNVGRKTIYVHNDMFEEYKLKRNFNKKIIYGAYRCYHDIALVNEELVPGFNKNLKSVVNKIKLAPNFIGKDRVIRLSQHNLDAVIGDVIFHFSSDNYKWLDSICVSRYGYGTKANENLLNLLRDSSTKVFLNIGRFSPEKGHLNLIEAFEQHYQKNAHSALVIIGGYGGDLSIIVDKCMSSTAKDNIFILGSTSNPFPILKACDAFILSSKYEGLGLVVFEAAALDVPVITVNLPVVTKYIDGSAIIVENSVNGLLEGMSTFSISGGVKNNVNFDKIDKDAFDGMQRIYGSEREK